MSDTLTAAQQDRIAKIEQYGHARVGVFSIDADGTAHVEIVHPLNGARPMTLDTDGRLHDIAEDAS